MALGGRHRHRRSGYRTGASPPRSPRLPARAFSADSWWNTPLPDDAPLDPAADQILDYLRTGPESGRGCLTLAGAGDSPWGQPIYDAAPGDPSTTSRASPSRSRSCGRLRIPRGAQAAGEQRQQHDHLRPARRGTSWRSPAPTTTRSRDAWSAEGATVTYLDSNGLHVGTGRSDDPRNRGSHRGNNGATMAVELDEVQSGAVRHVLKVAAGPEVADRFVFPMVGLRRRLPRLRPGRAAAGPAAPDQAVGRPRRAWTCSPRPW